MFNQSTFNKVTAQIPITLLLIFSFGLHAAVYAAKQQSLIEQIGWKGATQTLSEKPDSSLPIPALTQ